jgi:hypothetical protein
MKQYVVDDLRIEDFQMLKKHLEEYVETDALEGMYWIKMDDKLLNDIQKQHTDCQPYYLAIELEENRLSCELLVRSRNRIRCHCMGYVNKVQFQWAVRFIDNIFEDLSIVT